MKHAIGQMTSLFHVYFMDFWVKKSGNKIFWDGCTLPAFLQTFHSILWNWHFWWLYHFLSALDVLDMILQFFIIKFFSHICNISYRISGHAWCRVPLSSNSFFITVIACSQCILHSTKQLPKDVTYSSDMCFHTTLLGLILCWPNATLTF
jgi:hypothetical protein